MEERRTAHRYKLSVAVVVWRLSKAIASDPVHAKTRDVSTRGLHFTSSQRLAVGTRVGLSLTLQATNSIWVVVDAKAKVVRVEKYPNDVTGRVGIAAVIDSYNIVRPQSAA